MPSLRPPPDTTQSAAAGLWPGMGVPGLCRHPAGQAGGRGGDWPPSPTLADGCLRRLARGAVLCPPSPLLDQAEANAHADGLTSHVAAHTKPEPTAVALGPGPGPEAAMPPALGLLGGLGRLLALGGPHRTWWPGRGCRSCQAPHCGLPRDADPVHTPETLLVGTGLLGMPKARALSPGCPPALGIVWPWQEGWGWWSAPPVVCLWVSGLVRPLGAGQPVARPGAQGRVSPSARTLHPRFPAPVGRGGPGSFSGIFLPSACVLVRNVGVLGLLAPNAEWVLHVYVVEKNSEAERYALGWASRRR